MVPPKIVSTAELQSRTLKRGERVRLVTELPGVAAGAEGKVAIANGFTWNRYWVRFRDGRVIGHIDHGDLIRAKHYERFLLARDREAAQALLAPVDRDEDAGGEEPSQGDDSGGEAVVNGVVIPAYLLQRSADARARLGT